ncbi:MAG: TetR/AcrR family transcriptional regulator [Dermatophilaceae bacterium]
MPISPETQARGVRLPRPARRVQLLRAAQEVFVEYGYHAAAMDDIAERAGVSKPVLYQHFPGKLDLYLALLDQHSGELLGLVRAALASTTDNKARVAASIAAYFEFVDRDGAPFRLVFESDLNNETAVRERVEKLSEDSAKAIAEVIKEDTDLPDDEAHLLGMALSGMAQISARFWLSQGSSIPRDEAARLVAALSWRGLGGFPKIEREGSGADAG